MKKIVSVSLGSSKRDHSVNTCLLGIDFEISRRGTDGNFDRALELLRELDGNVDAIGLGGIDLYLYAGKTRYAVSDGLKLMEAVKKTPVVDGSGLKNTLERETVYYLSKNTQLLPPGCKVLMVSAADRFGMAGALTELGCDMTFGDLIFSAGIPYPIKSVEELEEIARKTLPEMTRLPFHMLYPTGEKQDTQDEKKVEKYGHYYHGAEVIAGDYHLVRRYMPGNLKGQVVITNTTTRDDVKFLKEKGVGWLVTTTPELEGRSFGTNVMEAALVVLLGKNWEDITPGDYLELMRRLDMKPRVQRL
ncbi:MAG: quinate 5-dehydrogenase [Peptococcaceae bacterium BRH_c4a]|nr:MAG: quinate 5-dehydrogenase [Peptococcaceae bacterium BRH_c4a]